jgi:Phospholipase_D-nuclease N-terminal
MESTMIFHLLIVGLLLGATVFWVYMIIDCATKEPTGGNDKLIWILIIIFTHWIGALIYYFVRRPQRVAELGS